MAAVWLLLLSVQGSQTIVLCLQVLDLHITLSSRIRQLCLCILYASHNGSLTQAEKGTRLYE